MISSSIRLSFTGGQVGWTMNTSRPRTFSMISTLTSPSLKRPTAMRPSGRFKWYAMSRASAGCALPVKIVVEIGSKIRSFEAEQWLGW